MYLSRFAVSNYKCLGEIDIPLTPIHVIIGENDAGKTSLLEAMEFFFRSADGPLSTALPANSREEDLLNHASKEAHISLGGWWHKDTASKGDPLPRAAWGFRAECQNQRQRKDLRVVREWAEKGGTEEIIQTRENNAGMTGTALWQQRTGGSSYQALREHRKWLPDHLFEAPMRLALNPKMMALPVEWQQESTFSLAEDGFGLARLLQDLVNHDAEQFVTLQERFRRAFPQFSRISLSRQHGLRREEKGGAARVKSGGTGVLLNLQSTSGHLVPAQHLSDGVLICLALFALSYVPHPPNLLLIEEPENGIYPKRLEEVITLLKQMVEREEEPRFPQIIMTTHSPLVLSHFAPEEVTFLRRPKGDPDGPVTAWPLRDAPRIRERIADGFFLGELWYNLGEEALFGEP